MKIGIQTWGSTGDVNPFIALAAGLAKAGHAVTLVITSAERRDFAATGARLGFRVVQAGHIGESEEALNDLGRELFAISNPVSQLATIFERMFDPGVAAMYAAAQSLCAENDLIIAHFIVHPAQLAAEQAGKPYVTVALNHGGIPTRFVPPSPLPDLGRWGNALLWKLAGKMINNMVLPSINRLRSFWLQVECVLCYPSHVALDARSGIGGNPVAVVLLDAWPPGSVLAAIAGSHNAAIMHALCILSGGDAMSQTLTIRNVPDALARRLKSRAERNHRSLQGEVMAILVHASAASTVEQTAAPYRASLSASGAKTTAPETAPQPAAGAVGKKLTIEEIWERGKRLGLSSPKESARIVRKLRDERHSR